MRWRSHCIGHEGDSLPNNTLGMLLCDKEIHTCPSFELLQILTTDPVSIATNEHSFSVLSHLGTYLRFTTKEDRLNRFVLLYVHRGLIINCEHVFGKFSRKNRRLNYNSVKF